jgi:hypothetical protein
MLGTGCAKFCSHERIFPQAGRYTFTVIVWFAIREFRRWMSQSAYQIETSRLADKCRLRSRADHKIMMMPDWDCFGVFCRRECGGTSGHSCCMDGNPHCNFVVGSPRSDDQSVRHSISVCSLLFVISDKYLEIRMIDSSMPQFRYGLFTKPQINHSKPAFSFISPEIRTQ